MPYWAIFHSLRGVGTIKKVASVDTFGVDVWASKALVDTSVVNVDRSSV